MRRTGNRNKDLTFEKRIRDDQGFHFDFINQRYSISRLGSGKEINSDISSLWSYTRSGTEGSYVGQDGVVILNPAANLPKIEYNPGTLSPRGLFFEAAQTNDILQSADFSTTWTTVNSSVATDTTTAPDNSSDADTLTEDGTAGAAHTVNQTIDFITSRTSNFSVWAKLNGRNWIYLELPATAFTSVQRAWFNVSTGVVGTVSGSVLRYTHIQAYPNGWYRCMIGLASSTASVTADVIIGLANADNTTTYNGDGASGVFLWGAQYTQGSPSGLYYSNYIPTTTVAVTANATVNVKAFTALDFSQTRGTYLVEFEIPETTFGASSNSMFNNNTRGIGNGLNGLTDTAQTVQSQATSNIFGVKRIGFSYGPNGMHAVGAVTGNVSATRVEDYSGGGNGCSEFSHTQHTSTSFNLPIYGGSLGSSTTTIPCWVRKAHFICGRTYSMTELMSWVHHGRAISI